MQERGGRNGAATAATAAAGTAPPTGDGPPATEEAHTTTPWRFQKGWIGFARCYGFGKTWAAAPEGSAKVGSHAEEQSSRTDTGRTRRASNAGGAAQPKHPGAPPPLAKLEQYRDKLKVQTERDDEWPEDVLSEAASDCTEADEVALEPIGTWFGALLTFDLKKREKAQPRVLQIVLKDVSAQNIASRLQALEKQGEKEWTEKQQQQPVA